MTDKLGKSSKYHDLGETGENHKSFSQDSQCLGQDMNQPPTDQEKYRHGNVISDMSHVMMQSVDEATGH
jgi:hypothetical protein